MRVLLIVDLQNDFCPGGALGVDGGHEIVKTINDLMASGQYDMIVATQDWHPANHVSFVDNHPGESIFAVVTTKYGPQVMWPRHCEQNTEGAKLHADLKVNLIDHLIHKGTDPAIDSYSGFYDNGKLKETELRKIIENSAQERGLRNSDVTLSVCGLALDFCVNATARDAVDLGFKTELLVDATRAVCLSPGDDVKVLRDLVSRGVTLVNSRDVLVTERVINRSINLNLGA
jgi:nicotinamidase/pyrazinamidase